MATDRESKMCPTEQDLRAAIVAASRWLVDQGLNQGTSGNVSARIGSAMLITPSAIGCDRMTADMMATMPLDSTDGSWTGPLKPSSEWRLHRDILRSRPEIGAVVHTHAPHAAALAMARRDIPPCHYMVAAFGGRDIRCSGYARFGTAQLSTLALAALDGRRGCLLANHGMVVLGADLAEALKLAAELETLARQYCLSLGVGGPVLLTDAEIEEALAGFATYGRPEASGRPRRKKRPD